MSIAERVDTDQGQWIALIDAQLRTYVQTLDDGCPKRLREAMEYTLLSPGKRTRPLLTLMAAESCGGSVRDALPAACAVEMVHAFSLIHDDLPAMDDDDLRRGQPTNHIVYGEGQAILAGDALFALAFSTLAEGIRPPAVAMQCCALLSIAAGATGMGGGQSDDVAGLGPDADVQDLEALHARKTGALIEAALQMGGLVAGATPRQLLALAEYGWRIGLAFQITDDLLDTEGDSAKVGKSVQKDAGKGKLTYPQLIGVDESRSYVRELVEGACGQLAQFGNAAEQLRKTALHIIERER